MADFGAPVAQNVNPVGQGLQTLSGLLSVQQQRLGLQQTQQAIQGQAAEVQQQQQTARQRSNLAGFMQHFDPSKHVGSDGTLDLDSVLTDPNLRAAAGDKFPEVAQQFVALKSGQLQTKQQLAGLNDTLRNQFSDTVGSLRTDPDVVADNPQGRAKVQAAMGTFAESGGPDAARIANTYAGIINHVPQGKLTSALSNFQLQAMDASTQASHQAPAMLDTGPSFQNTNPQAAPTEIQKGLAPTDQPGYRGAVASATTRASGNAGSDIDRGNMVSGLQQQASAAIPLTERIDQLADDIHSGKVAKMISETGNYFGLSSINEARSQLNKDLGQVKGLAIANVGSDSRAATVLEGYPTDTTPAQTTHAAMDYIRGSARQTLARGQLLSQYQKTDPGLKGFQAADTILTGTSNPLMHEFMALPPAQRAGFYQRNFSTPEEAQAFKNRVTALQKHTNGIAGQ